MKISTFVSCVAILLLASDPGVDAFWRLLCRGTLGVAQIDPVVNFGEIAPHAHMIVGGSNVGFFTDTADLQASNCTSCNIVEDKSAYWAPALYFQYDNGTFELVQTSGGMLVYYFTDNVGYAEDGSPASPLTAFPPDFRMVAGNNNLRDFPYPVPDRQMASWQPSDKTQAALAAKGTGFNCMHYYNGVPTEGSMDFHYLRNKTFLDATCDQGVRFELEFPSCWDGVRLDSEDHRSHILYPDGVKTGTCPEGFNVRTPVIFFETIWDTYAFANESGAFVIANGDTEGYGYHGDFYSGWNQTFLQNAINTCTNSSGVAQDCPLFTIQDDSESTSCFLNMPEELRAEDYQGPIPALPGNVPISTGPGLAAKLEGTPVTGTTKAAAPTTLPGGSTVPQGTGPTIPSSSSAVNPASNDIPSRTPSTPASTSTTPTQAPGTVFTSDYPATTAAPSSADNPPLSILTTSTFTSDGHEIHLIIYESIMTVTDAVGPTKRHDHRHAKAHARGGHV